jgi:3-dehydroquinate synthase
MARQINVHLKASIDRSYQIAINPKVLADMASVLSRKWMGRSVFIITDSIVSGLYGQRLQNDLTDSGFEVILVDFPSGEQSKNASVIHALHTQLLTNSIRRNSLIIALGGGVVGDVAGYVAATILRGVKFIQVPTTLLSQVDSSVGGKVGIDHPLGKNLIGAFHQPSAVFIDPTVLKTLSEKEFRNGLAEVVKIAAALDISFFSFIERNARKITRTNVKLLSEIIRRSVALKAAVVEKDEHESGIRKVLNLGHTIGHALEAASNYSLKHGEAVSLGIVAESRLAVKLGLLREVDYKRVVKLLTTLKLPTRIPQIKNKTKFFRTLGTDKKSEGAQNMFVLLNGIGKSAIGVEVPMELIARAIFQRNGA